MTNGLNKIMAIWRIMWAEEFFLMTPSSVTSSHLAKSNTSKIKQLVELYRNTGVNQLEQ